MKNKKKFLIIIFLVINVIVFYMGIKEANGKNANSEIQEEQNVIIENIVSDNIETENVDNNVASMLIEDNSDISIEETNNNSKNNEQKQNNNLKNDSAKNESLTSTFDENAFINGHLKKYPQYREKYATLKIAKIGTNDSIYFGDSSEIIAKGIGHDMGSYFPGENGSILLCGHNYMNQFRKLGKLVNGDIIEIDTSYGDFYYRIYDNKVLLETEKYKIDIQHSKEILMIYTCYPLNATETTNQRYVIYAEKI